MIIRATLIVSAVLASVGAHAALQGRDLNGSPGSFEAYYDTDLNITWLADANYAQTSGYDADGWMSWPDANAWAASLAFTDGVNTYDNWRLPTTLRPDNTCSGRGVGASGFGCTGSEMGHLFTSNWEAPLVNPFYPVQIQIWRNLAIFRSSALTGPARNTGRHMASR